MREVRLDRGLYLANGRATSASSALCCNTLALVYSLEREELMRVELRDSEIKVPAVQQKTEEAEVALEHSHAQVESWSFELRDSESRVRAVQQKTKEAEVALEKSIKQAEKREKKLPLGAFAQILYLPPDSRFPFRASRPA